MRRWKCACGNPLFFDAVNCINCGGRTGMCPGCSCVVRLTPDENESFECSNPQCRSRVRLCDNYQIHSVCNRCAPFGEQVLCEYCRFNRVIPSLTIDGNLEKWRKLEAAKRRALDGVKQAGFVLSDAASWGGPCLSFRFMEGSVATGHSNGCITINVREADDVERERTRVEFGEPHRTLIGHFRHELGHYYWEGIVKRRRLGEFRDLFGNENEPSYSDAQQRYYESGPAHDWPSQFVSAYASMHPWEDFAETFNAYLDMTAILATVEHFDAGTLKARSLDAMVSEYKRIGIFVNELNRDMGLTDLVPQVFTPSIVAKLRFIHQLRATGGM